MGVRAYTQYCLGMKKSVVGAGLWRGSHEPATPTHRLHTVELFAHTALKIELPAYAHRHHPRGPLEAVAKGSNQGSADLGCEDGTRAPAMRWVLATS